MSIIRLYIEGDYSPNTTLTLTEGRHHYLHHVMRVKPQQILHIFNGIQGEWQASVLDSDKKQTTMQVLLQHRAQHQEPFIGLAFAPIKQRTEAMIEKATELGVTHLQPLFMDHSVVDKVNQERLQSIAIEAAEQCNRLTIPTIAPAMDMPQWLSQNKTMLLHADETGEGTPLLEWLRTEHTPTQHYHFLIGPEGGFSRKELAHLRSMPNLKPVTLGPRILRADTACFATLACWQACCGDWLHAPRFEAQ